MPVRAVLSSTNWMRQPLSHRERFIAPPESLVRIAELPQSPCGDRQANYPGISPGIAEGQRPMARRFIEGDRAFEMFSGAKELAHKVQGLSPRGLRVHQ